MLSTTAEQVRIAIYTHLARRGALPARSVLVDELGLTDSAYGLVLGELADARHIVLRDGDIEMAHPFATRSFGFSVMGPETLWWGGCAWDSFAIPHLVPDASDVLVATTCPACDTAHAWTVTNHTPPVGDQVAHFLVPMSEIWPDAAHACGNQRVFCSEACVSDWLARTGNRRGYVMSLEALSALSAHWYEGRLVTPYARREPAAAAAYFQSVGLRGPFWGLPNDDATTEDV